MAPLRARFVTVEAVETVLPLSCAVEVAVGVCEPLNFMLAELAPPTLGARVDAAGCGDFETAVELPFEMDFEVDFEVGFEVDIEVDIEVDFEADTETGFETV
jgi:hypothetical protein